MPVKLKHLGIEVTGRNKTEAKAAAEKMATEALREEYISALLCWRGNVVVMWRVPLTGWRSALIEKAETTLVNVRCNGCSYPPQDDLSVVILSARMNLAQLGWRAEDGYDPPDILAPSQYGDFKGWVEFQLRFREARERGLDERDARAYANRDPAKPEVWSEPVARSS